MINKPMVILLIVIAFLCLVCVNMIYRETQYTDINNKLCNLNNELVDSLNICADFLNVMHNANISMINKINSCK